MRRPSHSSLKRQKELARQQRKLEKRERLAAARRQRGASGEESDLAGDATPSDTASPDDASEDPEGTGGE